MELERFDNPEVAAVFDAYPEDVRDKLLALRQLIFDTAAKTEGVGQLQETLKWGEPSYLTPESKSGSTVRINWKESLGDQYAIYFKCTSTLVNDFKQRYPNEFEYQGNRAIMFNLGANIPTRELSHCIELALTYHLRKKLLKKPNSRRKSLR
ncbi:MAG: DUF1801 domain-containing protein [Chloroflexi bacterium]|nr:DUF1801 domain-containing protein [Chloroflexota bacterium]